MSAETTLKSRLNVCEGYANLYSALGNEAGLTVLKIPGYGKGFGYMLGENMDESNHVWNAVKIDGQWLMIEATWGAGFITKEKGFTRRFDEFYFLTPPEQFIFDHLPEDPKEQFVTPPVSKAEFQKWPRVNRSMFKIGISVQDIRDSLSQAGEFVETFDYPGQAIRIRKAQLKMKLTAGQTYEFEIEARGCLGMAIFNAEERKYVDTKADVFKLTVTPQQGPLQISAKLPGKGDLYWTILKYIVE